MNLNSYLLLFYINSELITDLNITAKTISPNEGTGISIHNLKISSGFIVKVPKATKRKKDTSEFIKPRKILVPQRTGSRKLKSTE